jgi:hypothetical protein
MPDVRCKAVLLCEEIREEKSGKYLLVGVYPGGIAVASFPAKIRASSYLILHADVAGEYEIEIKMKYKEAEQTFAVQFETLADNTEVSIPTPSASLTVIEDGAIEIFVGPTGGYLERVAACPVDERADIWTMFPSEPLQLSEQGPNAEQE